MTGNIYRRETIRKRNEIPDSGAGCPATEFSLDLDFTVNPKVVLHKINAEAIPEGKRKTCDVFEGLVPELDVGPRWRSTSSSHARLPDLKPVIVERMISANAILDACTRLAQCPDLVGSYSHYKPQTQPGRLLDIFGTCQGTCPGEPGEGLTVKPEVQR